MVGSVTKIIIGSRILLFATAIMILLSPFFYMIVYKNIISKKEQTLKHITAQATLEFHNLLKETEKSIHTIFEQQDIDALIDKLLTPIKQDSATPTEETIAQQFSITLKSYKNILTYKNILNYKNCIIFSPQGSVVFTDNPIYEHLSLEEPKLKNSALGASVVQVMMSLTNDIAEFSYDPYLNAPALYITVPLFKNQQLHAIVAVQLNAYTLYAITDDYRNLGTSGELNIGKKIPSGTLYLDSIRHNLVPPFKTFLPTSYASGLSSMQLATLGYTGSGKIAGINNVLSLASWQYIPRFDYGIVATIGYEEVLESLSPYISVLYLLLLLFCVLCCMHALYDPNLYDYLKVKIYSLHIYQHACRYLLNSMWLISCIALIISLYCFFALHKNIRKAEETAVAAKTSLIQQQIDHILYTTQLVIGSIVYDINFNRLEKEDIIKRLERDIQQNPFISGISITYAPYAYEKNKKLFGRYVNRTATGTEIFNLDEIYDYTSKTIASGSFGVFYLDTLAKKGSVWINPTIETLSKKYTTACSEEFYETHDKTNKLAGVVTVFVDMQTISNTIESIAINTSSPSYLLSNNGVFIYRPKPHTIYGEKNTIINMAKLNGSAGLITLWENRQKNLEKFMPFYDESIKKTKLAFFLPIAKANWFIGLFLSKNIFLPPTLQLRHYYMMILFCLTFFIICSLMVCSRLYNYMYGTYLSSLYTLLVPLIICFFLLLYISYKYQTFQGTNKIPITDQIQLDQFITEKKEIATIIHEDALIPLPTGIEINSLEIAGIQNVKISGIIWQKYDDILHKGIIPGVYFKEASGDVTLKKIYETHIGTTKTVGWNFFILIPFYMREKLYPLDANQVSIAIEHPDVSRNILLVPDVAGYGTMQPSTLPGIISNFKLLGFDLQESFFNFETLQIKSTRGSEEFGQATSYITLKFNIILVRRIMYALLVFFLPIFIIMFAIYAFFIMGEKIKLDAFQMLTAYTGFLLTIVFLHRALRDQTATGTIMYIEYFFFLTYFMIFVFILNIILEYMDIRVAKSLSAVLKLFYKKFFWELQLLMSIIITTIIFY